MLIGGDYVSEQQQPTGLLFIPRIIYECGGPWWNDTDRRKPKNSETELSQCHFVGQKSHID
jgi:hypothetical protein